uniref:NADH-ubiquinone oxidoreductase chain 4 n=1 Tax=Paraconotrochus antarcticus TaxID=2666516 RepID=A0A7T1W6T5_9CNID|nr:NADH dehydrogenase subunit 4 [Paraconotrochus antarcticus]QPO84679.1 NADH dehydrogenase subunit 4 [Paraconotrochus antarcticus]
MGVLSVVKTSREKKNKLKRNTLEWSLGVLLSVFLLWGGFDLEGQFQFLTQMEWVFSPILGLQWGPVVFALDGVSLLFLSLTTLLIPICVLVTEEESVHLFKEFLLCLLALEFLLIGVFLTLDLLIFYVLFEGILIPMFLLIGVWGSREEKVRASYYFFFFTFAGSAFMLVGFFQFYWSAGTTDYLTLLNIRALETIQKWVLIGFFFSFAVKIPLIPLHIWLPQAHVEAPVSGSVILAGVLLKLGGYGLLRFSWPLLPGASRYWTPLIFTLGLIAVVLGGLTTCRQVDFKRLVAYSSVAHMGLVPLGLFSQTYEGLVGAVFLMLAHGLVSSALFIVVTFLYVRSHSRLIKYYRGVVFSMPLFAIVLLILSLTNMGFPSSSSFIGEFFSMLATFKYNYGVGVLASSGVVLSAAYSLYMYNRMCFGAASNFLLYTRDLSRREFLGVLPFLFFILFFGVCPFILVDPIKNGALFSVVA